MGGPTRRLHPDFGPAGDGEAPYGIPYAVVGADHPRVRVTFEYADESDDIAYPFGPDTPVESGSDRHALALDRDAWWWGASAVRTGSTGALCRSSPGARSG